MGEFKSGKWIVILSLYFFMYFIIVFSLVQGAQSVGNDLNINYQDPGFQTLADPFETGGYCTGNPESLACSGLTEVVDNVTCEYIFGCNWVNATSTCIGTPADPDTLFPIGFCTPSYNYTYCSLVGCTWTNYDSNVDIATYNSDSKISMSPVTKTIAVMTGYDGENEAGFLNIPEAFVMIFSFMFFWLPFVMLLLAIYFAIPFAH